MRVWVKLLIGSILGITLGFLLPEGQRLMEALVWVEQFTLRVGRYVVVPMLVFSLTVGIYELRQDRQFWPLVLKNCILILGISAFVISVGVLVASIIQPVRIPVFAEEQLEKIGLDIAGNITDLFPYNLLSVLACVGIYLFPICIFAFFFGMGLSYDKRSYSKPVISLVDSLSRVFYHIVLFFIEILGFMLIVLSCYWTVQFRDVLRADIFKDLMLLLGILVAVLAFGILPLFIYFLRPKSNPWAVLYGSLGPAITAFFSGDINFTLPVLLSHAKENFGVQRRSNTVTLALFSTFCRAGSAMVAIVSFIVIYKSYSRLGISSTEIFALGAHALAISFLLARHPGDGAYIALAVLCIGYGRSFETGYLILKPLAFYLIAVGTFLDVVIASFASFAIARISGFIGEKSEARSI
jgi:Na+/H+-dicarboxylate symporter